MPDLDRFDRHGRLCVSGDRTHLVHADGTPFFYLADTAWNGPLLSGEGDWATYLDDRAGKGFTAIQFVTHAPWTAALADREGRVAFTGDAGSPLDKAFFDRLEGKVAAINERGMLAVPVLAWAANFGSGRLSVGHRASARELIPIVREQVRRLGRHHVMLCMAGDGVYNFWRARKWKRVARAVFGGVADRPPVTIHPAGQSWPYGRFADEPWLDVYGYQSSHSEHAASLRWLQAGPPATFWKSRPRPTINLEPVYEDIAPGGGRPFDDAAVRRAAYWSLLNAPTAGVAYGAHGLWGWHETAVEALNHAGMGVGQSWQVAMNFPGSRDMARLAAFFTSIEWWKLRPAPGLVEQPFPGDPAKYVAAAAAADGAVAVIYLPTGGEVVIRRGGVGADSRATWFNPRTGERKAGAGDGRFVAPDSRDWLLLLRPRAVA